MSKVKVACIGDPELHTFLSRNLSEWDWQIPVETIEDFYQEIDHGIDVNTRAIFIHDGFFDPTGKDDSFEVAIARFAPHAMVAVLNYNREYNSSIQRLVLNVAQNNGWDEEKFFFVDSQQFFPSLEKALQETVDYHGSSDVAEAFAPFVPDSSSPPPQQYSQGDFGGSSSSTTNYHDGRSVVQNTEKLGKVVCVTSSKGGSGKSTVAISLASYIARSSEISKNSGIEAKALSVAIVDLDVRDGQLGFVTGAMQPTVLQIAIKNEISVETVSPYAIYNPGLHCDLFLAPKSGRSHDEVPPQFYNELIQTLRLMYDYIILDTSVNYMDKLLEEVAYPSADQIIFVTDLGVQSVFGLTRWIREVTGEGSKVPSDKGMGINKNKIGIVVNKTMPNVGMTSDTIKKASMGIPILTNLPSMPVMVTAAANSRHLEELTNNKEFNKYIRFLASAVVGKKYKLSHIERK